MNIFFVDRDPYKAAAALHDRHIIKMISESCQMLSVWAQRYEHEHWPEVRDSLPWTKITHENHPCTLWLNDRPGNAHWLAKHLEGLVHEYDIRYPGNKDKFERARVLWPILRAWFEREYVWTFMGAPPQCVPDQYKVEGGKEAHAVEAYREYYRKEKASGNNWKTSPPDWLIPPPPPKPKTPVSQLRIGKKKEEPEKKGIGHIRIKKK